MRGEESLTHNSEGDGVTEDRAGVDLALVLPGVREGHVPDDQLPLPSTEVLPHGQPGVLQQSEDHQDPADRNTGRTGGHFILGHSTVLLQLILQQ